MKKFTQKAHDKFRLIIQTISAVLVNGYAIGFAKGQIFTGKTKFVCVPVLNCYSCPGALGACPIGAMQAVIGGHKHNFTFYVLGTLMLFGVLVGRLICGFLCPFGLVQDLLYKIPSKKLKVPKKIDRPLRYVKYLMLAFLVVLLPMFLTNKYGVAPPFFCKWVCPAGTLGGAFPLLITNESLRTAIGFLFNWKVGVLILIVVLSVFISRPFCKYICPLGAFYSVFNKFSFFQMDLDKSKCVGCKACEKVCPMDIEVTKNINSLECIRCGKCKSVCPTDAITSRMFSNKTKIKTKLPL